MSEKTGKNAAAPLVRLVRELPAAPEEVFDAWTDPESVRNWLCPFDLRLSAVEIDARVGGRFRIVMSDADGDYEHTGEYLELARPDRLVFTWASPATGGKPSRVTVALRPKGGGTELTLTHERLPDEDAADKHRRGWGSVLEKLADRLARRGPREEAR